MKAVIYERYGSPMNLRLMETEKPEPGADEVLVAVQAASVNYSDPTFLHGKPLIVRLMGAGLFKPKNPVLGADISGRIESVGKDVTRFKPGDEVFGDISDCGFGGFAEYVTAVAEFLVHKPNCLTFDGAAAVPQAACTALQGLKVAGEIQPGQKVLINGASGGIGSFAVQIAKSYDAEVTGVCGTSNVDLVRSIGADHVIDYKKGDFTSGKLQYDLILDIVANKSVKEYARALSPTGTYVACAFNPSSLFLGPMLSKKEGRQFKTLVAKTNATDLQVLCPLLESGKIKTVIGRRYPLAEVADAIEYYGKRHAGGKVVIKIL